MPEHGNELTVRLRCLRALYGAAEVLALPPLLGWNPRRKRRAAYGARNKPERLAGMVGKIATREFVRRPDAAILAVEMKWIRRRDPLAVTVQLVAPLMSPGSCPGIVLGAFVKRQSELSE